MESADSFLTIRTGSHTEIKIKGSKFIGQAMSCINEAEADRILGQVRKKYHDATHHCFGYRVGSGNECKFRYSDAGEPSGTAGKPIFDQIEGRNLTDLIVIVTRYFGGTKLGTGGLAHAYSDSAALTIEKAGIIEKYITGSIPMKLTFPDYNSVERLIHQFKGNIVNSEFSDTVQLVVEMRLSLIDRFKIEAIELTSGRIEFE